MRTVDHWINGESRQPKSGEYLTIKDPVSGKEVSRVALGGEDEVNDAVESARRAQSAWAALAPVERGKILQAIGREIRARGDEIAQFEISETGKIASGLPQEIDDSADYFEYYGGIIRAFFGETIGLGEGQHAYTRHEPYGVIGIITPWNGPLTQASRAVAPALAVGNAVVLKPSEFTSTTSTVLARIASEVGLPAGVLNVVTGTGAHVGTPLASHHDVRKVAFTGSVVTGRKIAAIASKRLIPVTLELGGKSPNIVFADANLKEAAKKATSFTNKSGQVCSALTRLLVEEPIYDEFVAMVADLVREITPGDRLAPLTTASQFEKVQSYFDIAEKEGAKAVVGGRVANDGALANGQYVEATVYTDVLPNMRIFQEEIFGPVLSVTKFSGEEEAIKLANATDYGLIASLWTSDAGRAHRVAARLDAGQVLINGGVAGNETPFGGYKNSGIGREKGFQALRDYTQLKTVVLALNN